MRPGHPIIGSGAQGIMLGVDVRLPILGSGAQGITLGVDVRLPILGSGAQGIKLERQCPRCGLLHARVFTAETDARCQTWARHCELSSGPRLRTTHP